MNSPTIALQPREMEILPLLAHGFNSREIGSILFLSPNTVKSYTLRMRRKFNTVNFITLITDAIRFNILVFDDEEYKWSINTHALDFSKSQTRPYTRVTNDNRLKDSRV